MSSETNLGFFSSQCKEESIIFMWFTLYLTWFILNRGMEGGWGGERVSTIDILTRRKKGEKEVWKKGRKGEKGVMEQGRKGTHSYETQQDFHWSFSYNLFIQLTQSYQSILFVKTKIESGLWNYGIEGNNFAYLTYERDVFKCLETQILQDMCNTSLFGFCVSISPWLLPVSLTSSSKLPSLQ